MYILRTVPAASTDLGGVKVTTNYEKTHSDTSDLSSASGMDSPQPEPYVTSDLLSLRVSMGKESVHGGEEWWERLSLTTAFLLTHTEF